MVGGFFKDVDVGTSCGGGVLHHHARVGTFLAVARGLLDVESFQGGKLLVR